MLLDPINFFRKKIFFRPTDPENFQKVTRNTNFFVRPYNRGNSRWKKTIGESDCFWGHLILFMKSDSDSGARENKTINQLLAILKRTTLKVF